MPWDPKVYNKFKDIRYQPFYDLISFIEHAEKMKAVDLGCGTGEQTSILAEKFADAHFLGVDSSPEMMERSRSLNRANLHFRRSTTEEVIASGEMWDLVFSNAALQWSDNHLVLFPRLINLIKPSGQFAVQMPVQNENLLNKILFDLVQEAPFKSYLQGWTRTTPVLSMDEYAQILFEGGLQQIKIIQKVYPIITHDVDSLYNFISGSALIPYMERLEAGQRELFTRSFKERIAEKFKRLPAIYAFKRLLLYGRRIS